jgi:hypothetical protein
LQEIVLVFKNKQPPLTSAAPLMAKIPLRFSSSDGRSERRKKWRFGRLAKMPFFPAR